ncbi:hypothetical protein B0H19DRAFT_931247 [Mycena capillaripes]|nr:hypothetical protein B0H19DRAFT_931247 [Mycena capillaripes]
MPDANEDAFIGEDSVPTALLPSHYILTVPHIHSGLPSTITPLDQPILPSSAQTFARGICPTKPFAPFRCFADYDFTSNCVRYAKSSKQIQQELDALHSGTWAGECKLTIRTVKDMRASLDAARQVNNIPFERTTIHVNFDGETDRFRRSYEVEIDFRDPWKVIQDWICDETLAARSTWFSIRKYYCRGGSTVEHQEELFDEPWTGTTWREVDDSLPGDSLYPSCYLPLHIWLDKGQVSTKVKMHPILLRGLWIDSAIRNASGNGGSALLGYIIMPPELRNIDMKSLSAPEKEDLTKIKSLVYNEINSVILHSLKARSGYGDTFRFGDGVRRTGYPGILIESMDFQELAAWLAIRSAMANFPCPKCLVPKSQLSQLTKRFEHRTPASMEAVLNQARRKHTKGEKEAVLRNSGIHNPQQILWEFANSDPYKATSYDTLHWTDGGKFGRHLWEVTKTYLKDLGKTNEFNECLEDFPRWRGLKHISAATLIDYSEGQTFLDILKCILPCLVHLLPAKSALVNALRALQQFRMLVGVHCSSESRLALLNTFVREYEIACRGVHNKDFDFLKQHYTSHAADDIRQKGTTNHMSTRTGEGFQQDVTRHYGLTNGKDAERQMVRIDESEEAMARIDMIVADHNAREKQQSEDSEDKANQLAPCIDEAHWRLAAPDKNLTSRRFEAAMCSTAAGELFDGFDLALREFLATTYPDLQLAFEDVIMVQSFRAIHIHFQSKVDWTAQHDILRCSPSFHGRPRYDYILYNADVDPLSFARMISLLRCKVPSGQSFDFAYVRGFKKSKWRPRTEWKGCQVVEESGKPFFLSFDCVARGALLAHARGTTRNNLYFPLDTVDDDMFFRLNNID